MTRVAIAFAIAMLGLPAADLAGRYELRGVPEAGSELLLRPDGRFEFGLAYGAADYQAKGTWKAEAGAVILKSDEAKTAPFRLKRSAAANDGGVRVWVLGPKGNGAENIDVVLTTDQGVVRGHTSGDGLAAFERAEGAKSARIEIPVYEFVSEAVTLNPDHNEFWFEINGEAITRMDFKDERLLIEDGALVMRKRGADRPMRYVRQ